MQLAIGNRPSTLSPDARRLLEYLQRWCGVRERAQTDARIALTLDLDVRVVIELRRELIRAGYLVVSENTAPLGAWLVTRESDLAAARAYAARLRRRGVEILAGIWKPLTRAIAAEESRRSVEPSGQRRLF